MPDIVAEKKVYKVKNPKFKYPGQEPGLETEKLATQVVTMRMPLDLLAQIDSLATRRRSARSRLLLDLIRQGLAASNLTELTDEALATLATHANSSREILDAIQDIHNRLNNLPIEQRG